MAKKIKYSAPPETFLKMWEKVHLLSQVNQKDCVLLVEAGRRAQRLKRHIDIQVSSGRTVRCLNASELMYV